ncbi:MAG: glycoside hydrolase family 71/99-like protein [Verrucomicrobiales bacterium]
MTMVHYMPWYSSKPFSAQWGWHWTMNHFNPDKVTREGDRALASHYQPLIGPYDSNDPDALECQVLLMKFAGIDGVIIDWYGISDFNDYAAIHRNTGHLVRHIRKAGLKFAVCYEDQTVANMVKGGAIKKGEDVLHGKKTLQWLQENWFTDDAYLRVGQRPLMLVFGPMHFIREQWHGIAAGLHPPPLLYSLPHLSQKANADGIFGWPPVHGGKKIVPEAWRKYLRELYARGRKGERVIAPVFPGFHDIYSQAGVHESYGFLDDGGGATFAETLDLAWQSESRLIQVATWNDYGEGTIIEPTTSFGYRYLEMLQKRAGDRPGKAFAFTADHLRLAVKLYQLRKQNKGDRQALDKLRRVSTLLFSSRCAEAAILLNEAGKHTLKIDDKLQEPFK